MRANKSLPLPDAKGDLCNVPCFKGELVTRLIRRMPAPSRLHMAIAAFGALADRQRIKILYALRDGEELCVCDVAHVLGASVSTASHHLRKLRDMGILKDRDDGRMVYYSLRDSPIAGLVSEAMGHVGR